MYRHDRRRWCAVLDDSSGRWTSDWKMKRKMALCVRLRRRARPCWPPDCCCCCSTASEDDLRHGGLPPNRYRFGGHCSIPVSLPVEEDLFRRVFSQYNNNNTVKLVYSEFRRCKTSVITNKKYEKDVLIFNFYFLCSAMRIHLWSY